MLSDQSLFAIAQSTIRTEINGLEMLLSSLNTDSFVRAVRILSSLKGRVMCTGIGKSGHIGLKITSTLASIGIPSSFIHPSEALHGDLGMISSSDCVIMISNSGQSAELLGILNYVAKNNITLIAICGNQDSNLAKLATVLLLTPKAPEACPIGKVPTTSTTIALALGDALATALMAEKNFDHNLFAELHPGGSIGASLTKISKIMHTGALPLIKSEDTIDQAIISMTTHKFGCTGVIDSSGVMVGMITDGDIRRHMTSDLLQYKAQDIMSKEFTYFSQDMLAVQVLNKLVSKSITCGFILDDNKKPLGIIHIHDLNLMPLQ